MSMSGLQVVRDLNLPVLPVCGKLKPHTFQDLPKSVSLSQMSNAYTSTVVLGCGMEVKESGGDYNEAVMKLGIWCSAGLEKMWPLCNEDSDKTMKPLIRICWQWR